MFYLIFLLGHIVLVTELMARLYNAAPKMFCLMFMNFSNEKFYEHCLVLH